MQIAVNSTGMPAGLAVAVDRDARDHCVVVVKGTFQVGSGGEMSLAAEQRLPVATDEHYGNPEDSGVRRECDFALEKPLTDVIVVGKAVAPGGRPVKELSVRLEVEDRVKTVIVRGERRWVRSLASFTATDPQPFTEMPLIYERAFGGWSEGRKPVDMRVERRNPVGIGFHATDGPERIDGAPLPNLERPERPITSPRECLEPVGYGVVGRSWLPRVARAGTYDARWRDERAPFLPEDFDSRYFQCAPDDQQFPHFRGGEQLRCVHMASQSVVQYVIPRLEMRVWFRFFDDVVEQAAVLDTVTLEPHDSLATIVWRASTPLRKKLADLEHIFVGEPPGGTRQRSGRTDVKPVFSGLGEAVAWARRRRGCST